MQGGHERAWAEALAQEHAHQQELLVAFRGELGGFAHECAAALAALDSCVAGLDTLADAVDTARTGYEHAALVLDVSRRLPGLAPTTVAVDDELAGLYAGLAEGGEAGRADVRVAPDSAGERPGLQPLRAGARLARARGLAPRGHRRLQSRRLGAPRHGHRHDHDVGLGVHGVVRGHGDQDGPGAAALPAALELTRRQPGPS